MSNANIVIDFYLNGELKQETVSPEITALSFLRERFNLTGAKNSCNEGDCGSCTIALGREQDGAFCYLAINSCILPVTKLNGSHVITIEGLGDEESLHIIQKTILEERATQCGYCTPGVIMSLFCLLTNNDKPSVEDIYCALEGNLCRCTGYLAITRAANSLAENIKANPSKFKKLLFPDYVDRVQKELRNDENLRGQYVVPKSLAELFPFLEKGYKIINGGTDLMVRANIYREYHEKLLDISRVKELNFIEQSDNCLLVGGNVSLKGILNSQLITEKIPILQEGISKMASTQIRNVATLAGNIANASPIADAACILLGLGAILILKSKDGEREIELKDFYCSYKETALRKGELIYAIKTPPLQGFCKFEKSAKRAAVDISTVNSLLNIEIKNGKVSFCRIAFGGVAPYPKLVEKGAEFLLGKELTEKNINIAAEIAITEFSTISDVRGSKEYRNLLIKNHIIKSLQG